MDDARGHPAEAMAGAAMPAPGRGRRARRARASRARGAVGRAGGRVRRDRHPPGRTGRRAAAREAADGRRRMGPRAAPGPGRGRPAAPGLRLTMARGPAAGRGRSHGPHAGDTPGTRTDKPGTRSDKPASRTGTPGTRGGKAAPRADKPASRAGTPRGRRRGGTGGAPGRRIDPARLVAFDVLRAVRERDAYANLVLPALLRERGLTGRDAAFATELSYGACRSLGLLDAVIGACAGRSVDEIDGPLLDVLRLGVYQLLRT